MYAENNRKGNLNIFHSFLLQDTAKSGSSSVLTFFEAHNNAIFDVAWVPGSQSQLVTVSGDQSAKLWDFSNVKTTSEVDVLRVFRFVIRLLDYLNQGTLGSQIVAKIKSSHFTGPKDNHLIHSLILSFNLRTAVLTKSIFWNYTAR